MADCRAPPRPAPAALARAGPPLNALNRTPALLSGAALNVAGRVLTLALGLALLVLVARMGPQVQGALALFMAVEALLVAAASGLGLALAREAAGGPLPRARLRPRLLAALGWGLLAGLGLALASRLATGPGYAQLWLLALAAPLLLLGPTVQGLWLGQGRLLALNAAQAAAPGLALLALLGLAWAAAPAPLLPVAVLAAWATARALLGLACAWLAWHAAGQASPTGAGGAAGGLGAGGGDVADGQDGQDGRDGPDVPGKGVAPGWRFLLGVAAGNVIGLLNLRATLFIVEHHGGLAAAGVYSVAVQVAELLWVLSAAVSVSAYHALRAGDPGAAALALRTVRLGWGLALVAAPVLGALGWWALPALLGADYAAARQPLLLLLPGVVAYAAASGLSAFHTQALGRPQWAAKVAAGSLLLTLLLAAWAVPHWGPSGAALATTLAYTATMAVVVPAFLRRHGWGWRQLLGAPLPRQSAP